MCRLTRYLTRILFAVIMPVILVACGSNTSGPSSGVLSGFSAVIDGTTWTFGANGYGQLGNNSTNDSHSPVNVGSSYSEVAIGGGHVVARIGGTVYTWGYNSNGQLGNGSTTNSSTPVQVSIPGKNIIQVAAGARFSLALADDGTVWAWGNNNRGQLGNNSTTDSSTPVQVIGLAGITMIAAGGEFGLASDGKDVWAWGSNDNGQLGINSTGSTATPVQVPSLSGMDITHIAAGASHSLAVVGANNLYSWGYNSFGQLGNGSAGINNNPNIPSSADQLVPGLVSLTGTQITMISAGLSHSMAVVDGTVYAWGYNFFGQIGNSAKLYTNTVITSPLAVPIGTNFTSAIATGNHSIALDNIGHIWTWGMNTYGQLGDGTTTDRSTPAIVPGH